MEFDKDLDNFIKSIIDLYEKSQYIKFPAGENIIRKTNHSISSDTEDLFAILIAKTLSHDSKYFITPNISFNKSKEEIEEKKKINPEKRVPKYRYLQPDIAIASEMIEKDNFCVNHFIDLKTDLGWGKKKYVEWIINKGKLLNWIRGKKGSILKDRKENKKKILFHVSATAHFHIVSVSSENVSKSIREELLDLCSKIETISLYFLTTKIHPNHITHSNWDKERVFTEINKNYADFENLIDNLSENT